MSQKTCFVIMPIRKTGTAENAHFRAIFNHMRPTLEEYDYSVLRADDIKNAGAITKDIVSRLAESDLVVADLTDLNPNVFYELGVRHALRGKGTVMILDERRSPDIPFDLQAYRVIKFIGDLTGIESLTRALSRFLREAEEQDAAWRDNPVHDWFPMLPVNVLDAAGQSTEAPLRTTIKQLQERIDQYEKAFGSNLPQKSVEHSPLSAILAAVSDAEDGLLPSNVLDEARVAYMTKNAVAFLQKVRTVVERNVRLPSSVFMTLAQYAANLDLDGVDKSLFEQALQFHPNDLNLKRCYLATLAHSNSPADRDQARRGISAELSLEFTENEVVIHEPARLEEDLMFVGILLDAFHADELHTQALSITSKLIEIYPESSMLLRNHGRALHRTGDLPNALRVYRESLFTPDVDDTSGIWLGNQLHNQGKHLSAAEAYAFGCLLDPADAKNFAHLAEELSLCVGARQSNLISIEDGCLPEDISQEEIVRVAHCSASCNNQDSDSTNRLRTAFGRLELDVQLPEESLSRVERLAIAKGIYDRLQSTLTTRDAVHDFGLKIDEIPGNQSSTPRHS